MDNEKIQELLLQLIRDMSYVKAKLDNIDDQKFSSRIDQLEAQNREHDRTIKALEHRNDTMEQFVRNNIVESKRAQSSAIVGVGIAILSAFVSFLFGVL